MLTNCPYCSKDMAGNHADNCPMQIHRTVSIPSVFSPPPFYRPTTEGWICPRCKKVHAPWVSACECVEYPLSNAQNGFIQITAVKKTNA